MTETVVRHLRKQTANEFIIHPDSMIMGQRTKSYFIEPSGDVDSFAVCFYPYGFANFVSTPLDKLVDIETPIKNLFREMDLQQKRGSIIESFLPVNQQTFYLLSCD